MATILLSGGAGYVGSHIAYALARAGLTPIVLDNFHRGHQAFAKYGPVVVGDIADDDLVRATIDRYKPETLIHCAALIDVAESVRDPDSYWDNNHTRATRFFATAEACGLKNIIFSSTAAVYGVPHGETPITENHSLAPINPYGASKLATETYLQSRDAAGVRSVILRYFNASGAAPAAEQLGEAHLPETHLIPNLLLAGLGQREPVQLFGTDYPTPDGTAIRDYVHVLDLAEAHIAAMLYLQQGSPSGIFNLGTEKGSSVAEVLAAAEQVLGHKIPTVPAPRRAGDPPRLVADARRAAQVLGWRPRASLQDILQSAADWHRTDLYRALVKDNA